MPPAQDRAKAKAKRVRQINKPLVAFALGALAALLCITMNIPLTWEAGDPVLVLMLFGATLCCIIVYIVLLESEDMRGPSGQAVGNE